MDTVRSHGVRPLPAWASRVIPAVGLLGLAIVNTSCSHEGETVAPTVEVPPQSIIAVAADQNGRLYFLDKAGRISDQDSNILGHLEHLGAMWTMGAISMNVAVSGEEVYVSLFGDILYLRPAAEADCIAYPPRAYRLLMSGYPADRLIGTLTLSGHLFHGSLAVGGEQNILFRMSPCVGAGSVTESLFNGGGDVWLIGTSGVFNVIDRELHSHPEGAMPLSGTGVWNMDAVANLAPPTRLITDLADEYHGKADPAFPDGKVVPYFQWRFFDHSLLIDVDERLFLLNMETHERIDFTSNGEGGILGRKVKHVTYWAGDDLLVYTITTEDYALLAMISGDSREPRMVRLPMVDGLFEGVYLPGERPGVLLLPAVDYESYNPQPGSFVMGRFYRQVFRNTTAYYIDLDDSGTLHPLDGPNFRDSLRAARERSIASGGGT